LMVVDEAQATLRRFDTALRFDGSSWKTVVSADEAGAVPLDVAIDEAAAELVMLTAFPFRVHRFDLEGRPRAAFEVPPARALAVGTGGRLWLASEDGPLLELDRNGRVVSRVGRPDLSPAEALGAGLRRVSSLGLDGRGRLAALDTANHRVVLFAASGELVGAVGSGLYARPARLEVFAPSPPSASRSLAVASPRWPPAPPSFRVELKPSPESFPAFEPFSLEVRVVSADFDGEGGDLQLVVDATMPAHRHGLSARPEVRALGKGRFRVDGLLLPMVGEWLLYLDLTSRGVTERLEVPVRIE
jgi:hypothetical protein